MSNYDYVEVSGPGSLDEVLAGLRAAVPALVEVGRGEHLDDPRVGLELDEHTAVQVYRDPYEDRPWIVQVACNQGGGMLRERARTVYEALAAATPWGLTLTSDDCGGPDPDREWVLAERPPAPGGHRA